MRFNLVLLGLMALSAISALAMPPTMGDSFRKLGVLFTPISFPVRLIAGSVDSRIVKPIPTPSGEMNAGRTAAQLRDDNETLKYQIDVLTMENKRLHARYDLLGGDRGKSAFRLVPVVGGDPGTQQVLTLQLLSGVEVAPKMPVLFPQTNLIGKIEVMGLAARVCLITDRNFAVTGIFQRERKDLGVFQDLPQQPKTMVGLGNGKMVVRSMLRDEAFIPGHPELSLAVGDRFMVRDKDLPDDVQTLKLGEVESITASKMPQFVTIVLRPDQDLMKLREVMLLTKR